MTTISVPARMLRDALAGTIPCASTDTTREHLHGILVRSHDDVLDVVGTDGHRLARYQALFEGSSAAVFVPYEDAKTLLRLLKMATKSAPDVTVEIDDEHRRVHLPTTQMTIKDGKDFPPYHQVIPDHMTRQTVPGRIAVDALLLSGCLGAFTAIHGKNARNPRSNPTVKIVPGQTALDAILILSPDVPELTCVLMPRRTSDTAEPFHQAAPTRRAA